MRSNGHIVPLGLTMASVPKNVTERRVINFANLKPLDLELLSAIIVGNEEAVKMATSSADEEFEELDFDIDVDGGFKVFDVIQPSDVFTVSLPHSMSNTLIWYRVSFNQVVCLRQLLDKRYYEVTTSYRYEDDIFIDMFKRNTNYRDHARVCDVLGVIEYDSQSKSVNWTATCYRAIIASDVNPHELTDAADSVLKYVLTQCLAQGTANYFPKDGATKVKLDERYLGENSVLYFSPTVPMVCFPIVSFPFDQKDSPHGYRVVILENDIQFDKVGSATYETWYQLTPSVEKMILREKKNVVTIYTGVGAHERANQDYTLGNRLGRVRCHQPLVVGESRILVNRYYDGLSLINVITENLKLPQQDKNRLTTGNVLRLIENFLFAVLELQSYGRDCHAFSWQSIIKRNGLLDVMIVGIDETHETGTALAKLSIGDILKKLFSMCRDNLTEEDIRNIAEIRATLGVLENITQMNLISCINKLRYMIFQRRCQRKNIPMYLYTELQCTYNKANRLNWTLYWMSRKTVRNSDPKEYIEALQDAMTGLPDGSDLLTQEFATAMRVKVFNVCTTKQELTDVANAIFNAFCGRLPVLDQYGTICEYEDGILRKATSYKDELSTIWCELITIAKNLEDISPLESLCFKIHTLMVEIKRILDYCCQTPFSLDAIIDCINKSERSLGALAHKAQIISEFDSDNDSDSGENRRDIIPRVLKQITVKVRALKAAIESCEEIDAIELHEDQLVFFEALLRQHEKNGVDEIKKGEIYILAPEQGGSVFNVLRCAQTIDLNTRNVLLAQCPLTVDKVRAQVVRQELVKQTALSPGFISMSAITLHSPQSSPLSSPSKKARSATGAKIAMDPVDERPKRKSPSKATVTTSSSYGRPLFLGDKEQQTDNDMTATAPARVGQFMIKKK